MPDNQDTNNTADDWWSSHRGNGERIITEPRFEKLRKSDWYGIEQPKVQSESEQQQDVVFVLHKLLDCLNELTDLPCWEALVLCLRIQTVE